jgi:hypothetical protein
MGLIYYPLGAPIYETIDVEVTLRCNWRCENCIKFCNMQNETGLDYRDTDMSMGQIENFVSEVEKIGAEKKQLVTNTVFLTGGEPLLHPDIIEMAKLVKTLVDKSLIRSLAINSNLVKKAPEELKPFVVNFSTTEQKAQIHNTVLIHPDDMEQRRPSFATCKHYRKWRIVLSRYGYNMCCAGDGYMRLFGEEELFIDHLPDSPNGFPLDKMDRVCQHCPFGCDMIAMEKDVGCPISKIYAEQAELNRNGRKIQKIYPSKSHS